MCVLQALPTRQRLAVHSTLRGFLPLRVPSDAHSTNHVERHGPFTGCNLHALCRAHSATVMPSCLLAAAQFLSLPPDTLHRCLRRFLLNALLTAGYHREVSTPLSSAPRTSFARTTAESIATASSGAVVAFAPPCLSASDCLSLSRLQSPMVPGAWELMLLPAQGECWGEEGRGGVSGRGEKVKRGVMEGNEMEGVKRKSVGRENAALPAVLSLTDGLTAARASAMREHMRAVQELRRERGGAWPVRVPCLLALKQRSSDANGQLAKAAEGYGNQRVPDAYASTAAGQQSLTPLAPLPPGATPRASLRRLPAGAHGSSSQVDEGRSGLAAPGEDGGVPEPRPPLPECIFGVQLALTARPAVAQVSADAVPCLGRAASVAAGHADVDGGVAASGGKGLGFFVENESGQEGSNEGSSEMGRRWGEDDNTRSSALHEVREGKDKGEELHSAPESETGWFDDSSVGGDLPWPGFGDGVEDGAVHSPSEPGDTEEWILVPYGNSEAKGTHERMGARVSSAPEAPYVVEMDDDDNERESAMALVRAGGKDEGNGGGSSAGQRSETAVDGCSAVIDIEVRVKLPMPFLIEAQAEFSDNHGRTVQGSVGSVPVGVEDLFVAVGELHGEARGGGLVPGDISQVDLFDALWDKCAPRSRPKQLSASNAGSGAADGAAGMSDRGRLTVEPMAGPRDPQRKVPQEEKQACVESQEMANSVEAVRVVDMPVWEVVGIVKRSFGRFVVDWRTGEDQMKQNIVPTATARGGVDALEQRDTKRRGGPSSSSTDELSSSHSVSRIKVLIFLPPAYHVLLVFEVEKGSTLSRVRTDFWPCAVHVDEYIEHLFNT